MSSKIAFGCDHRGFEIKDEVISMLKAKGFDVIDCGTDSADSCDYTDHIFDAALRIKKGECSRAIGVCFTGIGSSIAANKVVGVRASLVRNVKEAELTRAHNDSNMLILGTAFLDKKILAELISKWLETPFEGGRHERRVNKIKKYEQPHDR